MHAFYTNDVEASLWASVVACDTDSTSDNDDSDSDEDSNMSTVDVNAIGEDSAHNDLGCCGYQSAVLASKPREDLETDAGKLWDPNQGSLRGLHVASDGFLQEMAAMIIMTVMYSARVARFELLDT